MVVRIKLDCIDAHTKPCCWRSCRWHKTIPVRPAARPNCTFQSLFMLIDMSKDRAEHAEAGLRAKPHPAAQQPAAYWSLLPVLHVLSMLLSACAWMPASMSTADEPCFGQTVTYFSGNGHKLCASEQNGDEVSLFWMSRVNYRCGCQ